MFTANESRTCRAATVAVPAILLIAAACSSRQVATVDTAQAESTPAAPMAIDWSAVDTAMGRAGAVQAADVHRYSFPRTDFRVTVDGVALRPAFALGGWIAMKAVSDGAVAMGDLVLADAEIEPVISALQAGGVEQTALHHHLLRESPRLYYMHVHAHGDPVKIAETIRTAMALTKAPPATAAPAAAGSAAFGLDTAQVAAALGYHGRVNGGVFQVGVPRAGAVHDGAFTIPPSMGISTGINFQPTSGGRAIITGDFVLVDTEVNPVIRALREGGIEVSALHNHMLSESPRLFFMHFWAQDDAVRLARVLRTALDRMDVRRAPPASG